MSVNVSLHAIQRYQQRVAHLSPGEIRTEIRRHARVIEAAAKFGCGCVILGDGVRLKLRGNTVATVIGKREGR